MGFIGAKVSDKDILDWLKSKSNQSEVIKEALYEKRLKELGQSKPKRPEFKIKGVIEV